MASLGYTPDELDKLESLMDKLPHVQGMFWAREEGWEQVIKGLHDIIYQKLKRAMSESLQDIGGLSPEVVERIFPPAVEVADNGDGTYTYTWKVTRSKYALDDLVGDLCSCCGQSTVLELDYGDRWCVKCGAITHGKGLHALCSVPNLAMETQASIKATNDLLDEQEAHIVRLRVTTKGPDEESLRVNWPSIFEPELPNARARAGMDADVVHNLGKVRYD